MSARRAVVRWAWRMLRREWRRQVIVLALLTLAVAAGIGWTAAVYNTVGAPDQAEFGTANHLYRFASDDRVTMQTRVDAAARWFGEVEVIAAWDARIPGSVDRVRYQAQDPDGPFGGPMLDATEGRYPRDGEVAVTDGVAEAFDLELGSTFDLDGVERLVVGRVENPNDLNREFALTAPGEDDAAESLTVLVHATTDQAQGFGAAGGEVAPGDDGVSGGPAPAAVDVEVSERADDTDLAVAAGVLSAVAVALLLVGLLAVASFVVVAQRRLRQLGMLAAVGADEKHLRLVMVAHGLLAGVVAAIAGCAAGLAGWFAMVPPLERASGHRIDPLHLPWSLVAATVLLTITTAVAAAWWPARAAATVPTTRALSGRPPQPRPVHRSGAVAVAVAGIGVAALVWNDQRHDLLAAAGTVATVVGVLLLAPLAIRALARMISARASVAVRLGLRDLARYQARSAAALAAISLTLGIPVSVVVLASAAEHDDSLGNLAADQLVVRLGNPNDPGAPCPGPVQANSSSGPCPFLQDRTLAEDRRLDTALDTLVDRLGGDPTVEAMEVAVDPAMEATPEGRPAVMLARAIGEDGFADVSLLFVATPELLDRYGIDPAALESDADILSVETGDLALVGLTQRATDVRTSEPVQPTPLSPIYSSLPGTLITEDGLRARGLERAPAGWLVEADGPIGADDYDAVRDLAATSGLIVEGRDEPESLTSLKLGATAVGMVVSLAVLALAVGLIRTEEAGDLRTLTATGATSGTRRVLAGATSGGLALLGVVLGIGGTYVALVAGFRRELEVLSAVPLVHLAVIAVGVPAIAFATGWALGGREPDRLATAQKQAVS